MCVGPYSPTHFPVCSQWWKCRLKVGRVPAAISARINSVQGPEHEHRGNGILLPKLFWPAVRKNCSSDREKLLKFETEGQEFAKFLKCQNNFW